jgi:isopenicillin N synthase-like dioxygenase
MKLQNIPVINIAELERADTLAALDNACREWGFFQVVEHGIDNTVLADLQREMRSFFAQPLAEKRAISRTAANPWGFYDRELTKNTLDWKQVYDYGPANDGVMAPQWPRTLPRFASVVRAYYTACETLAHQLLDAISLNLGMPANALRRGFDAEHTSFVRFNYYPKCPQPARPIGVNTPGAGHLGVNHHTDAGALTLLLQDEQPGLEVFRNGKWHLVEPQPDGLVINIGDIVQVWSNDRYQAALHGVRGSANAERFSAPFFFNPSYHTCYAPLPTTIDADHPRHYQAINWGEFRAQRAAGDYADCGEEVQVSHYRVGRS